MKKQRPVNLNLLSIRFPVTAISSILHRISGVVLFIGVPVLLWLLGLSLESQTGFEKASAFISAGFGKFLFWAILTALAYHIIAGIRHLLMDAGIGETLSGGMNGARAVLVLGVIAAVLLGVWLW
ncbi:succinate dehydrogenase, cytochrome b556 subunit [Pleionea sp. CnH1-48]|uniref:succinate dehydrogenase, cytochrome b556 subunit n=1 Tax=Pleionea sp. CnH1-48 TaxID=2954494 RepID=UPI0020971AD0|nr:succinate dehydrogenase, cytochrome b556 subunit [Pleionea sp. CnH1-48]